MSFFHFAGGGINKIYLWGGPGRKFAVGGVRILAWCGGGVGFCPGVHMESYGAAHV